MSETRRIDFFRDWAVDLAVGSVCAIFLGLIGPFGSYMNGPAWQRVAFQLACFWPGILLFGSLIRAVLRLRLKPAMTWISIILGVAILNAPFQIWVAWIAVSTWPFLQRLTPLDWYLQGLITAAPVVLGFTLWIQARLHKREQAKEAGDAPPTAFGLLGAPPSAVLCLQMEDHYVRVHSAGNSRLVLATLNQAMAALENSDGLQVHRSWWVARKAVVRAVTEGRNLRLQLVNGITAPVARSAVAMVREAGWLTNENPSGDPGTGNPGTRTETQSI
jgi:LytTr DNA-binding domain